MSSTAELEARAREFGALYERAAAAHAAPGTPAQARAELETALSRYKLLYRVITGQVAGSVVEAIKAVLGLGGSLDGYDDEGDGLGWLPALVGAGAIVARARAFASMVFSLGGAIAISKAMVYIAGGIAALTAAYRYVASDGVGASIGSSFDAVLFEPRADCTRAVRPWVLIGGAALAALVLARVVA
jgi:hypothetical protein